MSLPNGKAPPSLTVRGSSRQGGSWLQTRETTIVSEAYSESYKLSTSVTKPSQAVRNPNSGRDHNPNQVCVSRRGTREKSKKSPTTYPDPVTKQTVSKSEPSRKAFARPRAETSVNPLKHHDFVGNSYLPESPAGKPTQRSRTRVVASPNPKTTMTNYRAQNGWTRSSPSPTCSRAEILRKTKTHHESNRPDPLDQGRKGDFTRTGTDVSDPIKTERSSLEFDQHPPVHSEKSDSFDEPKREYTKECAVSAWLLQCNNASLTLDENDDPDADKTDGTKMMEGSEVFAPNANELEARISEPLRCVDPPSTSVRDNNNTDNSFFARLVPNTLADSSIFVKSATYSDVRRLREPCGASFTVDGFGLPNIPFDPRTGIELETASEHESPNKNEGNSVQAQDWTSVSSSEWGDEMCEFDRQQSLRVRKMFEEIDRMLFDATAVGDKGSSAVHPVHPSEQNKVSLTMDSLSPNRTDGDVPTEESDFNLKHLEVECQDWLSRFPHLRVCGKQILPPQETGFQFFTLTKTGTRFSTGANTDMRTNGSSTPLPKESNSPSTSVQNKRATDSHFLLETSDHLTPRNSPTRSIQNNCDLEEEIFAIHGEYEEVIAIDKDIVPHSSSRRRRRGHLQEHALPPSDTKHNLGASDQTAGVSSGRNEFVKTLLQLLSKEITQDLLEWLRSWTLAEKQSSVSSNILDVVAPDDSTAIRSGTGETNVAHSARTKAEEPSHSSRMPSEAIHGSKGVPDDSAGLHSTTPDSDGGSSNLAGLLQISAKTLQQRDKVSLHDVPESVSRASDQPGPLNAPASSFNYLSQINRLSPQPTLYPVAVVTGRSFSSIHPKVALNSSRKVIPTGMPTTTDLINGSASSAPSVVGVAANFHPVGRLAPLERVRTPSGSRLTSHPDESMTYGIDMSSHSVHRGKNLFGSVSHNMTVSQATPNQQLFNMLTSPTQPTFGISNAAVVPVDHVSSRGSCTLPPLGTGAVTSGMVQGIASTQLPNVISLLNPSKIGPVNSRLSSVTMQSISHLQLSSVTAQTPSCQPVPSAVQSVPSGQSVASHIGSSHSHAPALRGTSANLVTQQINNSGLIPAKPIQKPLQRKARTTRMRQTLAPSPCHWTKKTGRTWRPQTSIPSEKTLPVVCLPDLFDRSSSTLLIRQMMAENALSERNSPRKVYSQRSDQIQYKICGSR